MKIHSGKLLIVELVVAYYSAVIRFIPKILFPSLIHPLFRGYGNLIMATELIPTPFYMPIIPILMSSGLVTTFL